MSLIREYIQMCIHLLRLEGRASVARQKFNNISDDEFDYVIKNQPAGSNNKYLDWSLTQLTAGDDPMDIITTVNDFDQAKMYAYNDKQRDINTYKSLLTLKQAVEGYRQAGERKKVVKREEKMSDIIYDDEHFIIVRPHTPSAARKYAKGTKWCVGGRDENDFSSYAENGSRFFFLINRKATTRSKYSKIAFDYRDNTYASNDSRNESYVHAFDALDNPIPLSQVAEVIGSKYDDIMSAIEQNLMTNPEVQEFEIEF